MPQVIQCPHCAQPYELADEQVPQYAGQTINCTRCQQAFTVSREIAGGASPAGATSSYQPPSHLPSHLTSAGHAPADAYALPETSGFAIAAMVIGIVGIVIPLAGILAIVFGVIALKKIREPRAGGKGLARAGIVLGVAGTIITVCAITIFVLIVTRAAGHAHRTYCAGNMRQIGQAILLYANENSGAYPAKLEKLLLTQDIDAVSFVCPATNDTPAPGPGGTPQANALHAGGHLSYVYVGAGLTNQASADTVILYEPLTNHDDRGANFLRADGHVSWEDKDQANAIIAQLKSGQNPPKTGTK